MRNKFNLDTFLKTNQHLFAIMGIFGAVSIYLNTLNKDIIGASKNYIQIGILASLFLFTLISAVILKNLFKNTTSSEPQLLAIILDNLQRILFAIPFFTVSVSISSYMILNFTEFIKFIAEVVFLAIYVHLYFSLKRQRPK